jgi:outer membrane protein
MAITDYPEAIMRTIIIMALALVLVGASAFADSLNGRFGITGKGGGLVPLQDDFIRGTTDAKAGVAAGGGMIFGLGRNFAIEFDGTHVMNLEGNNAGAKAYDASFTDLALGIQYRVASENRLVPFFGAGVDFIKGQLKNSLGTRIDLDWTEGGHVNLGLDYFLTRGIALSLELRGMLAFEGDLKGFDTKYDPTSCLGTLGIRLILPEKTFW